MSDMYDSFMNVIKGRASCRSFDSEHLDDDTIRKVIDAGLWSASAHNTQQVYFFHIKDSDVRAALTSRTQKLMGGIDFDPFYSAPELIIVAAKDSVFAPYDGSIAMSHMMDAAHSLGLGSCWVNTAQLETTFDDSIIKAIGAKLGLRVPLVGVGYLALGKPRSHDDIQVKNRIGIRVFEV